MEWRAGIDERRETGGEKAQNFVSGIIYYFSPHFIISEVCIYLTIGGILD